MEYLRLDWAKLTNETTGGAASAVGTTRGLLGLVDKERDERGHYISTCLIHQQDLCCKVINTSPYHQCLRKVYCVIIHHDIDIISILIAQC